MKPRTFEEPKGNLTILQVIVNPKFYATRNFELPACESCMLERSRKRSTNTKKFKPLVEKEGSLSCAKIEVGDFVSTHNCFVRLVISQDTPYAIVL